MNGNSKTTPSPMVTQSLGRLWVGVAQQWAINWLALIILVELRLM